MSKGTTLHDRTILQFKVCMHCGHLQSAELSMCDKCGAGKIGLGKPREFWAYLELKIEGVLKLPDAGYVSTFKEEMVTGILNADEEKRRQKAKDKETRKATLVGFTCFQCLPECEPLKGIHESACPCNHDKEPLKT